MSVRVFLVDDHEVVRRGLSDLVSTAADIEIVGEAATAGMAVAGISTARPDVAVIDVRLPDGNGVEVCREIRVRHPEVACLMLTSYDDDEALFHAIVAGAAGYLLKDVRGAGLLDAIRRVADGDSLLDPTVTGRVLARLRRTDDGDPRLALLSEQERRILALIADGMTNRQIAERVNLAEKTVKNYVSNLLGKLGMHRRTEAAVFYVQLEQGP